MADKKITELPFIDTLSGSLVGTNTPIQNTVIPVVLRGTTNQINIENFSKFVNAYNATTGSNTFIGNQIVTGNVNISGRLTVNEVVAQYETSSILFSTGSTKLGDQLTDKHEFTGSTNVTGSLILNGSTLGFGELNSFTASQLAVNLGISSVTGALNTTTSSFDAVFLGISSVTGSINTTTSSFDSVFLGISSFTGSFNSISGSYATTGSNTFIGNQAITGSLSISAGEFNVITGSGNVTSSLRFDHTQNNGATLQLSHDNNTANADHTFNVNVWSAGVYTEFVRNGTPYSILNVEAFDDNKIYLYRDTRLYNKSLFIDNNLTVQNDVVIGTGSLDINNGEFSITSGSGELTSSLSFTHTTVDPITGNATLALRYRNNDVGPENNAWRFVADDGGVKLSYDQYATSNKLLFSVSSLGSNFDKLLIWRDARLYGKGLTVDDSLLVKGVITGSLLSTNGVVSSSNQLFELNQQTGSQSNLNAQIGIATGSLNAFTSSVIGQTNTISTFTSSVNFTTQSLNTQTGSQDLVNMGISSVTGSINTTTSSFNSVFSQIGSTTSSLIGITNGLMAFTAALDNTYATDAQLYQLYQATASIHLTTASLNIQTGSQDLVNRGISSVTGSINTTTSSFNNVFLGISSVTGAINTQSSSQDLVNLGISTFTGSIRSEVGLIEAYTASLKGATLISSSNQIFVNGTIISDNTSQKILATNSNILYLYSGTSGIYINNQANDTTIAQFTNAGQLTIGGPGNDQNLVFGGTNSSIYWGSGGPARMYYNVGDIKISSAGATDVLNVKNIGGISVSGGITGSLMATNGVISGSQQIIDYNTFALTSSANVFFGKQSVSGALHVANGITGSFKGNLAGVADYASTIVVVNTGTTTDTTLYPTFTTSPILAQYTSLYSHASSSFFYNGVTRRLHMEGLVVSGSNNNVEISGSFNVSGSTNLTGSVTINESRIDNGWTAYTPEWTAASSNPAINNGTIEGYYKVIGKTCFVRGNIAMGSTTTFGTGEWYVSMPFTASHADAILMAATLLDNGTAWYNATMLGARAGFNHKASIQYQTTGGTASDVNATGPFTWASGDRFVWNGSYEIA